MGDDYRSGGFDSKDDYRSRNDLSYSRSEDNRSSRSRSRSRSRRSRSYSRSKSPGGGGGGGSSRRFSTSNRFEGSSSNTGGRGGYSGRGRGGFGGGGGRGGYQGGAGGSTPKSAGVCYEFAKGSCSRGDSCRFQHTREAEADIVVPPCYEYPKGTCSRGDKCRFMHLESDREASEANALKLASSTSAGSAGGKSGGDPGICYPFQKGQCLRGDSCRYVHEKQNKSDSFPKGGRDSDRDRDGGSMPNLERGSSYNSDYNNNYRDNKSGGGGRGGGWDDNFPNNRYSDRGMSGGRGEYYNSNNNRSSFPDSNSNYNNKSTAVSAPPLAIKANSSSSSSSKLPHPWVEVIEKETGDIYYWNKSNGKTTWEKSDIFASSRDSHTPSSSSRYH